MTVYFPRNFVRTLGTKRATGTGTRRGTPATKLSGVRCSDLIPVDLESRKEIRGIDLAGLSVDLQVFCDPADIEREDVLFLDDSGAGANDEYVVVGVARYPVTNTKAMQVLLRKYQGA